MQNTFSQSGNDSKWFLTKIIFQNRYVALETGLDPPPFMANAILNFHFDYLNPSLIKPPPSLFYRSPILPLYATLSHFDLHPAYCLNTETCLQNLKANVPSQISFVIANINESVERSTTYLISMETFQSAVINFAVKCVNEVLKSQHFLVLCFS